MRGYGINLILKTADMLKESGFDFKFKATLSLKHVRLLPDIWDSYYDLYLRYPETVRYCPTLDVTSENEAGSLEQWRDVLRNQILRREFAFLKKHGTPLWTWFGNSDKISCSPHFRAHLHDDGKIYVCHGCPYSDCAENLVLGDVFKVSSLSSIIKENDVDSISQTCRDCDATYCAVCHALNIDGRFDVKSTLKTWNSCKPKFENKCKYYRIFGHESRILNSAYSQWLVGKLGAGSVNGCN